MNSIQTNSPVAARALEFAQEAKRKQEVEQQAATKTENKMGEHHTVQVSFSQEAQTRLSEEKTHDAKRVEEVRIASQIRASEQHSQAVTQEIQKAAEVKRGDREVRISKDRAASVKTEATVKAEAQSDKESAAAADAARAITASGVAKAIAAQARISKDFADKASAAITARTLNEHTKEANNSVEKASRDTARNNDEIKQLSKTEAERIKTSKVNTERANAQATKAVNMYNNVSKLK